MFLDFQGILVLLLSCSANAAIETLSFQQKVDHFSPKDFRSWTQFFYQDLSLHKTHQPILLNVWGEGQADTNGFSVGDPFYDLAKGLNAAMFVLEHRYYGLHVTNYSMPDGPCGSPASFKHLSSRQAVADAANFVKWLKATRPELFGKSKVFAYGCSYAGSLVTWLRRKYPNVVDGAIAASGPVYAKVEIPEHFDVAIKRMNTSGYPQCYPKLKEALETIYSVFQSPDGRRQLKDQFNICDSGNNWMTEDAATPKQMNLYTFVRKLIEPFTEAARSSSKPNA